jgi:hypothetical protein
MATRTGNAARFANLRLVAVDEAGSVYVGDADTIRKGVPAQVPVSIAISAPGFSVSGGQFGFTLNWLSIWTNTFKGALNFSDPQSATYSNRIYRTRTP